MCTRKEKKIRFHNNEKEVKKKKEGLLSYLDSCEIPLSV